MQVDKCERYNEKVCYTTQQEDCSDVSDKNCNAIVSSYQNRQCFNVTELKCRLQEAVTYETVQAVFTVQKCHTVTGLFRKSFLYSLLLKSLYALLIHICIYLQNVFATQSTRPMIPARMISNVSRSQIRLAPTLTRPSTTKLAAHLQSSIATTLADMELEPVLSEDTELKVVPLVVMEQSKTTASVLTAPSATTLLGIVLNLDMLLMYCFHAEQFFTCTFLL